MKHETILIVDDHPLVIEAISHAIFDVGNFNIISACSAVETKELLDPGKCADPNIRLIFLDIKLPDANGIDLIPNLISAYNIPIIAMSGGDDEAYVLSSCIKNGAAGFVRKSSNLTTFSTALRIVLEGGLYFPAEYINGKKLAPISNVVANLNPRQCQILDLIIMGKSNKQIGEEIFLAEGTVKNKVSDLLSLFNVSSRSQLIFEVTRLGYKSSIMEE
jgi:DNA-binding NarL/FixJ family response regulator